MKEIHYADHLEQMLGDALKAKGIDFIHESQGIIKGLDFYIVEYDLFIEVKQYHSDRIAKQLSKAKNVIVLQGIKSVEMFIKLLK